MIYFDHNATTPTDGRVVEAMLPFLNDFYGNPSGLYRAGRVARSAINTAREQLAALVGSPSANIIFTSGGTEANNLAFRVMVDNSVVMVSAIEHPSVIEPVKKCQQVLQIPVNEQGIVTLTAVTGVFNQQKQPGLVSVMLANNENGAVQNVKEMAAFFNDKKTLVHTDAVQALAKIPVDFDDLGVDLMSLSSHKIYGPKGCGALIVKNNIGIDPLLIGGGQESGWRAGTENVAAIVGFGKAAELAHLERIQRSDYCLKLRKQLEQGLKTIPELVIFSELVERLANTVQFAIKGIDGEMLLMLLDQKNIAVSSGSACASGGGKASSVLLAMGIDSQLAKGAVRISLGKDNTEAEIAEFIKVLKSIVVKG